MPDPKSQLLLDARHPVIFALMESAPTNILLGEWLVHAAVILGFLLAVVLVARILLEPRSPSGTLAWLLAIVLVPFVGVPLYLLIVGRKTRRQAERKGHLGLHGHPGAITPSPVDDLLATYGFPPAFPGHRVTLCGTGEEIYEALVNLIEGATKSIWISTFIIRNDAVGTAILDLLVRKASEGEDVESMKAATETLGEAIQKIGASVYEGQEVGNGTSEADAGSTPGGSGETPYSGDDDVIDGEVTE